MAEVAIAGDLATIASGMGVAFLIEVALHLAIIWLLLSDVGRYTPATQFRAGVLLVVAGTVFRVNTYLVAFQPGPNWSYFPAIPELLITLGIIALEVALYVAAVKKFPILAGAPTRARS
ncbi:MAG: hybB [Acidobacteria bacterium]|nr:hybB [Acidobacteriota bacterium]